MPVIKGKEKYLTLRLSPEEHMTLKVKSALRGLSIKRYILSLVNNDDELIIEPVNEDDLTAEEKEAIEEGRKDIKEGKTVSFDEYMKGRL